MAGEQHGDETGTLSGSADVFALLGDEVRLSILSTLGETDESVVGFAALHRQVGLADSGQFNYHLSKLVPQFVAKVEEGYQLTSAGRRVARAVEAGYYTDSVDIDPFATDGACPFCREQALEAAYTDEQFHVNCTACEETIIRVNAPPSLVRDRTPADALAAFDRWSQNRIRQAHRHGLCPYCGGTVTPTHRRDHAFERFAVLPAFECQVCSGSITTSFGAIAATDPVVEAFTERHRPEDLRRHYWEIEQFVTDRHVEIQSERPWRSTVTFPATGRRCLVTFDECHAVVRTEIERRE